MANHIDKKAVKRHMRFINATAKTGSFAGAADALNSYRQAVRANVAYFEKFIGVKLFERVPGTQEVRVTDEGKPFVMMAQAAFTR